MNVFKGTKPGWLPKDSIRHKVLIIVKLSIVKSTTIHIILTLHISSCWLIKQIDIDNVFSIW